MDIVVQCLAEEGRDVVSVKLPLTATYRVQETDPAPSMVSNEGKGTRLKSAILENGVGVTVPEFINAGELITVDLAEVKYRGRAKE
ncbi:hypothetical protein HDU98_002415 [Podochytrium sp. JEL0797]|nr:hypothetical protein HDU98_002415 [Podochytrium sp. JEL0797]